MANVFLTPQALAKQALASLYETTVMLPLVYTDVSSEFASQKIGNTVNIRKPAVFVANDFVRATGIVPQDATEGTYFRSGSILCVRTAWGLGKG